jgi:hypothetical protein
LKQSWKLAKKRCDSHDLLNRLLLFLVYGGSPEVSPALHGTSGEPQTTICGFLLFRVFFRAIIQEVEMLTYLNSWFYGFYFFWSRELPG